MRRRTGYRKFVTVPFIVLLSVIVIDAREPAASWLDTRPPKVIVEPSERIHRSVFHVTLSADEEAQIWFSREKTGSMQRYRRPISITADGTHRFYFYGEDDFGNRSRIDSIVYILDSRPPVIKITPAPGIYRKNTIIRIESNEPCRYFFTTDRSDTAGKPLADSFALAKNMKGYFVAVDMAGNRARTDIVEYKVDTSRLSITIDPPGGIYAVPKLISLTTAPDAEAFVTFDPLAPPEWFVRYTEPLRLPHGLTVVRYFARSPSGATSDIGSVSYIVDTIAPKLFAEARKGANADTLILYCKEKAVIRYTTDRTVPNESSPVYTAPISIVHSGIRRIRAKAWDRAGNSSEIFSWEYKYDHTPPVVSARPSGGVYRNPVNVMLIADEPARILYSINGSRVNESSLLFNPGGITISRQGVTELRFRGIDSADNISDEKIEKYVLDSRPPEIRERIEGDLKNDLFLVSLLCNEPLTIYYTVNGGEPTTASPVYRNPVPMKSGDVMKYFGVDSIGNATAVATIDDLKRALIEARPAPGLYNKKLLIGFEHRLEGRVWWRLLPDTLFVAGVDTVTIDREGAYSLEYFLQASDGSRSAVRRNEYFLDWTPPSVTVRVQRGVDDSVVIFFESDENASIYYTSDGTNPLFSATTKTAGNRFQMSADRISLKRTPEGRLAWYAEDAAGNQSALSVMDVFNPRVVPSVPSGPDRIYNRILSITLQSQNGAVIRYERHGRRPTKNSPVFRKPITLSASDTLVAFAEDASGYQGSADTFVYLIDLPPSPQFEFTPETVFVADVTIFDASGTFDRESPIQRLKFRWDFEGDGVFDTEWGFFPKVSHIFQNAGRFNSILEVSDEGGRREVFSRKVAVRKRCPDEMVAAFDASGAAFCIDRYEWPNKKGVEPLVNVSWVEAKMLCLDAGKRLCRYDEWISACNNEAASRYPYGNRYDPKRCATEEKTPLKSGSKEKCTVYGISDMLGNVWEWIEEKDGDYVQALGGSFRYGKDAYCALKSEGTVATRSNETGFRCCK